MSSLAVAGATTVGFWQLVFGKGPVPKALGKAIDTLTAPLAQGLDVGVSWLAAKQRAAAAVTDAKAEVEAERVRAEGEDRAKLARMQTQEERAALFHELQQNRRMRNIETATRHTADALGGTPDAEVSDEKVDPDWTTQWLNGVQDISDEDMQKLWAQVLAGEVVKPGSYSRKTLNVLKDLSKNDGETFQRFCSVVWDTMSSGRWAVTEHEWLLQKTMGIESPLQFQFTDCIQLAEVGLIEPVNDTRVRLVPEAGFALVYFGQAYLFDKPSPAPNRVHLRIGSIHLTRAGEELSRVVSGSPDPAYLDRILELYRGRGWRVRKTERFPDGAVRIPRADPDC